MNQGMNLMSAVLALLSLSTLAAMPARADDDAPAPSRQRFLPHFEVTPFIGYRFGGDFNYEDDFGGKQNIDVSDAASWGLDFGLYRDGNSFYELLFSSQPAKLQTEGLEAENLKLDTQYYHLGGTLLFPQQNHLVTWLSVTAGVTRFDPSGTLQGQQLDTESDFSMSLALGLRVPVNHNLAITGGVRGYLTFIDSSTSLFCVSNGGGACLFRISGSSYFQVEGLLGLTLVL